MNHSTNPSQRTATIKKIIVNVQNQVQIGNNFKLHLYAWAKIATVKQLICDKTGIAVADMTLLYKNAELARPQEDFEHYGIKNNSIINLLPRVSNKDKHFMLTSYDILDEESDAHKKFMKAKWEVEAALNAFITPKLTDFGTSGTYILESRSRDAVAIFKCQDEEPFAYSNIFKTSQKRPNNPRGYQGKFSSPGLRPGVLSGESVDREVAAFLIDQTVSGFHQVPVTTFVDFWHPSFSKNEHLMHSGDLQQTRSADHEHLIYHGDTQKVESVMENVPKKRGSFQIYVRHDDNVGNYGSSLFSVDQVQKIAILDLRILNCDRNEENILVRKKKIHLQNGKKQGSSYDFFLIPIDHGYSFPDSFNICQDEIVWFHWDQVKQPFTLQAMECIKKIDPAKDVQLIRSKMKFREICLRNLRIAEMVLVSGAKNGLTIYQIAQLMFREDMDSLSPLEKEVQRAEEYYNLNLPIPSVCVNGFTTHSNTQKNIDKPIHINMTTPLLNIIHEEVEIMNIQINCIKRSISQPVLTVTKSKINVKRRLYSEKFFAYFEVFIMNMIQQKIKSLNLNKKRSRYMSEDVK